MASKPTVILVGDVVADRAAAVATRSYDADKPTADDIDQISAWLGAAGYDVEVAPTVQGFTANPPKRSDIVVLPLWRGGASRNRTAIVPAVCEELGIPYVGGDVFVHTVCQDKSLSKVFLRSAGFSVPGEWLLVNAADVERFAPTRRLRSPIVVKPQYSAASIGIDDDSLCHTDAEAVRRARYLFEHGLGPVLCEEFVAGDEISLCFLEAAGKIEERCVVSYFDSTGAYPYRDRLMTFDEKAREDDDCRLVLWPHPIPEGWWDCAAALIKLLGKVDHMRIDARVHEGRLSVIELTQDSNLGLTSELVGGFNAAGLEPPQLFARLIGSATRTVAG